MSRISESLVRRLQAQTGADPAACRRALQDTDGDLERAALALSGLAIAGSLKSQFLIAMPSLHNEHFAQTVALMCEHNDHGAIALVVNRPTDLPLGEMLDRMGIAHEALQDCPPVFWGGPVQPERGFVIHREPGPWDSTLQLDDEIHITTSRDILASIGQGGGPKEFLVALGYAGWDSGQLEDEILRNSWLNTPADAAIVFRAPVRDRWKAATRLLGVDVIQLAGPAGHA